MSQNRKVVKNSYMLGSQYIKANTFKNCIQNGKKKTIYLGEEIKFNPVPQIYLHNIVLILNDSPIY